jgi:tRNA(Arg) A34 adenosine deaminase TadA
MVEDMQIKKRDIAMLERLRDEAELTPKSGAARISAAVALGRKIISTKTNRMKTHPLQAKYGKNSDSIYLHAEIGAIAAALRVIDPDDLEKCTLYIARRKNTEDNHHVFVDGLAKPCKGCMRAIEEFNIGRIVYTTNEDEPVVMSR